MVRWMIALALLVVPASAQAEWIEASSAHFVVYSEDSERDVRRFSEQLERFHAAMEFVTGVEAATPSPSNRVTVFVVGNQRDITRLTGSSIISGFYIPRAGGSVAFVPDIDVNNGKPSFSMVTLLHEYAHHFLISSSAFPSPRWLGEGGAEFFSAASFAPDGGVIMGLAAEHRSSELMYALNVRAAELVDTDKSEKRSRNGYDAFYGKSWALYHYLVFEPERQGQLGRYLQGMAAGKTSLQAAQEAFGDLDRLEGDLQRYLGRRRIMSLQIPPEQIEIGPIALRVLGAGEAAMMPISMRSRRGVTKEQALELLAEARAVAAQFPRDAPVLAALAEAEFDAGNDAEAIAAADGALALDPRQVNAYVQKGYALFRRAEDADEKNAAYAQAVEPFLALNRIENDHPLPLFYYFESFAARSVEPPEQAVRGLVRAVRLAPFDLDLRVALATYRLWSNDFAGARASLVPIAYNPHGAEQADSARQVIERIDAGGALAPDELVALLHPPQAEAPAAEGKSG